MDEPAPIHVLMRFADGFLSAQDTIDRHKEVLAEHGVVRIGKLGKTLGRAHVDRVNRQCEERVRTYLFLAQKVGRQYEVYRGKIVNIGYSLPRGEKNLVPKYYDALKITEQVSVWMKLSTLVKAKPHEFRDYRIASSKKPVLNALWGSMAAIFVIEEGIPMNY
ncbi:MAG: hypothetical protein ACYSWU_05270 [Planctomycetota bacterium]|jgi:hypothetical protein